MKNCLKYILCLACTCMLATSFVKASDLPSTLSGCIKLNGDGSETLAVSANGLDMTATTLGMTFWVRIPGTTGWSFSNFLELTATASPYYGPGGGTYTEGTFTLTIPATQAIPLNHCIDVWAGAFESSAPWNTEASPSTICPCASGSCYYATGGGADQVLRVGTPSADYTNLFVWVADAGTGSVPYGPFTVSGVGVPYGSGYDLTLDFNSNGIPLATSGECATIYVSDSWEDVFADYTPYDPSDPTSANGDNWAYSFSSCVCRPVVTFNTGCINQDAVSQYQWVTIATDNGSGINYMWYGNVQGMATQIGAATPNPAYNPSDPAGILPYIATFDFSTIGGGITVPMSCADFYFSSEPNDPRPSTSPINICACSAGEGSKQGSTVAYQPLAASLVLAPNPSQGSFTITGYLPSAKTSKQATIEVTDILGNIVYSIGSTLQNGNINTDVTLPGELGNGIYTVKIKNAEINEVKRLSLER